MNLPQFSPNFSRASPPPPPPWPEAIERSSTPFAILLLTKTKVWATSSCGSTIDWFFSNFHHRAAAGFPSGENPEPRFTPRRRLRHRTTDSSSNTLSFRRIFVLLGRNVTVGNPTGLDWVQLNEENSSAFPAELGSKEFFFRNHLIGWQPARLLQGGLFHPIWVPPLG